MKKPRRELASRRLPRTQWALLAIAVLAGPVIGVVVGRHAAGIERERARAHLERRVAAAVLAVERELAADLETLYAVRSLFEAGAPVTRDSFARMSRPFLARHPNLRALEWIPRVIRAERQAHEERVRDEGLAGYTITERLASGELVAAGDRDVHFPVAFVEPFEGNERAFGFDLGSDRLRSEAIERAAATGEPALTDPISLVQETPATPGVLALLAIFEEGSASSEAPRESPSGFVLAVFQIDRLLQQARLGPDDVAVSGVRFELVDDDVDGGAVVVSGSSATRSQGLARGMSVEQAMEIGGQRWRLVGHPSEEYMKPLRTPQPLLLGAVTATAWELLVGLVAILGKRTRDRLERRHSRLMSSILESVPDGVVVADTAGAILTANRAASAMAGQLARDLPPAAWSEAFGLFVPGTEGLFPPDELPLARAIRGEATRNVDVLIRNAQVPDATHVSVSGAPLFDEGGSVRGGVVVFRDITERKRAEERLRRLSSAVEQTADSVLITDSQGTIEYVNSAFEGTTGYSSAEALGKKPSILKSGVHSPEYYRGLWAAILRGEAFRGTTVNRKKSGELYYAEQTITPIKDSEGGITHFVSVLKDMTERRKLQEREIEMEVAAKVQRRLFPATPPRLPGYDLAGVVFPTESTSGDYFDFVPTASDGLAIVAADVSGHGLGPALLMAETRAYLHSLASTADDVVSIAETLNRLLRADLAENFFVTMLLVRLEPSTGLFSYFNAGHPSGYIVGRDGEVTAELAATCMPLGVFAERWRGAGSEGVLGPGETAILVTDGVLESESPEGVEFGSGRLLEVLREHRGCPARESLERVYAAVLEFTQDQKLSDDVTIVVCKRDEG